MDKNAIKKYATWARRELISLVKKDGFEQAMEEVAYTWFNRFSALPSTHGCSCLVHRIINNWLYRAE